MCLKRAQSHVCAAHCQARRGLLDDGDTDADAIRARYAAGGVQTVRGCSEGK